MNFNELIRGSVICNNIVYDSKVINTMIDNTMNLLECKLSDKDTLVALALPRNIFLVTTMIALLKLRIAFLLIDLELPESRVNYMLKHTDIKKIISDSRIDRNYFIQYNRINIDTDFVSSGTTTNNRESELAYVIYTSGTTGYPKAVAIKRAGLSNFIEGIGQIIQFKAGKKIACFTSISFDIFMLESVMALYLGMTVVLANDKECNNPRKMIDLIIRHKIQLLQMVPSRLRMIQAIDDNLDCLKNIETIMVGGEAFPETLLLKLKDANKNMQIYNMYGPTETTIWSTISNLSTQNCVDIGRPIKGTKLFLLNEDLLEVTNCEIGEIYISGSGLAKGYVNDAELTDKAFVKLGIDNSVIAYRTGDLGKYDANGNLVCLGRKDEQIKLRGYRIELSDIDENIIRLNGISEAAACFDEKKEKIILYYTGSSRLENGLIREYAKSVLPGYMIPSSFQFIDSLLYTSSGKIDRKGLLEKYCTQVSSEKIAAENNSIVLKVVDVFEKYIEEQGDVQQLIKIPLIDFSLDSLTYIKLIVDFEEAFHIEFDDEFLILTDTMTLEDIIHYISDLKVLNETMI